MFNVQEYYDYCEEMTSLNHKYASLMIEAYYAEIAHKYTKSILLKDKASQVQQSYHSMIEAFDLIHR